MSPTLGGTTTPGWGYGGGTPTAPPQDLTAASVAADYAPPPLAVTARPATRIIGLLVIDWVHVTNGRLNIWKRDGVTSLLSMRIHFNEDPPNLPYLIDLGAGIVISEPWLYSFTCTAGQFDVLLYYGDT